MVYRNTKPDSPKGQIYTRYASSGKEAALAHGRTLGVDDKRMLRWFEQWGAVSLVAQTAKSEVTSKPSKSNIKVRWTDRPAKLIARGDQCSEIKWLDTGSHQAIPNDQIQFAKQA